MLAKANRITSADDYRVIVRRGAKVAGAHTVSYLRSRESGTDARFGFIVSKKVGGAVRRNLVRRRLKAVCHEALGRRRASGVDVVVRALPGAAEAEWAELRAEVLEAFTASDARPAGSRRVADDARSRPVPGAPPPQRRGAAASRLSRRHLPALRRRLPVLPVMLGVRTRVGAATRSRSSAPPSRRWRIVRCNPWTAGGIDDVRAARHDRYRITTFGWVVPKGMFPKAEADAAAARRRPRARTPGHGADTGVARHSHLRPLTAEPALTNSSPILSRKD